MAWTPKMGPQLTKDMEEVGALRPMLQLKGLPLSSQERSPLVVIVQRGRPTIKAAVIIATRIAVNKIVVRMISFTPVMGWRFTERRPTRKVRQLKLATTIFLMITADLSLME